MPIGGIADTGVVLKRKFWKSQCVLGAGNAFEELIIYMDAKPSAGLPVDNDEGPIARHDTDAENIDFYDECDKASQNPTPATI